MASRRKAAFEPDPWLAHVLKRPAYRWTGGHGDPQFRGPGFYHARLESSNIPALKRWLRMGFRLVDVAVTAERLPAGVCLSPGPATRLLRPGDAAALRDWAWRCFTQSRFHLDPGLSEQEAQAVKRAWVDEILSGRRGDRTWVGLWKGRVVGFLVRRTVAESGRKVGVLDLMAVRPSSRGRGVGESLVRCFLRDSAADCALFRVGTQASNARSLKLYERCGFRISATHFVVHLDRGRRQ